MQPIVNKNSCRQTRAHQRGTGLAELVVLLPLLLLMLLVSVDFGRYVYNNQVLIDLTREAANMASRGTEPADVFAAGFLTQGTLNVVANGGVIISEVRRHSTTDATPWIFAQYRNGGLGSTASRVGALNGRATIPNVTQVQLGVTMMAVEMVYPFVPAFDLARLGLHLYPNALYDVAYF